MTPRCTVLLPIACLLALVPAPAAGDSTSDTEARLRRHMRETMRADYRGETDRLDGLAQALAADTTHGPLAGWAHYWRGFARWRRAANLMNEDPASSPARLDLREAASAFERASAWPELFADAASARAGCLMTLAAMSGSWDSLRAAIPVYVPLLDAAQAAEPDNPRVKWVSSMNVLYTPPAAGGGADSALALMERGVVEARSQSARERHPLAPTWGEAENLLNLAWTWTHRPGADPVRAEGYAREALRLVPDWHYVRDILMPTIVEARRAAGR